MDEGPRQNRPMCTRWIAVGYLIVPRGARTLSRGQVANTRWMPQYGRSQNHAPLRGF
jgi:hypothetical protein